jgi:hypothetical protein
MGMFDSYEPAELFECPWCGGAVQGTWYGKSGPCLLLHFRRGERHPVAHPVDGYVRFDETKLRAFELPEEFDLTGRCPAGHSIDGVGRCVDGVWVETDISETVRKAEDDAERARIKKLRESWQ